MYLIFILLILILILFIIFSSYKLNENLSQDLISVPQSGDEQTFAADEEPCDKCPFPFRDEWSYCRQDPSTLCYRCKFQRVGLEWESDPRCCHNICQQIACKKSKPDLPPEIDRSPNRRRVARRRPELPPVYTGFGKHVTEPFVDSISGIPIKVLDHKYLETTNYGRDLGHFNNNEILTQDPLVEGPGKFHHYKGHIYLRKDRLGERLPKEKLVHHLKSNLCGKIRTKIDDLNAPMSFIPSKDQPNRCPPLNVCNKEAQIKAEEVPRTAREPYWCREFTRCFPRYQYIHGKPWCGIMALGSQAAPVYRTLGQCKKSIDPFKHLNRYQCLRTTGTGWCTDSNGCGKCVAGAQDRPTDLARYNYCFPNRVNGVNSYIPGNGDPFFLRDFRDDDI